MRGRRRVRSLYSLPLRAYGNTISDDITGSIANNSINNTEFQLAPT